MITSSLIQEPVICICHKVSGTPTIEELSLAIKHTLQHDDLVVIWDLREVPLNRNMLAHEDRIRLLIGNLRVEMSTRKRAFLVTGDVHVGFEQFLGRLRLPWSWAVFESWDAAMDWLQI